MKAIQSGWHLSPDLKDRLKPDCVHHCRDPCKQPIAWLMVQPTWVWFSPPMDGSVVECLSSGFWICRNIWMQTLAEYVLTFVSRPIIRQLACFGKTAGVRRNLNFYWAFNEDKKQSGFNTWRSLHGLKIPDRSHFQGKTVHCHPFKWTFLMGIAGGGGGGVTQLIRS